MQVLLIIFSVLGSAFVILSILQYTLRKLARCKYCGSKNISWHSSELVCWHRCEDCGRLGCAK